jgi:O-antigen ligase
MAHVATGRIVRMQSGLTLATLATALLLGGGQGTPGDTVAQLLALALLAVLAWACDERAALPAWTWLPVLAVVMIPLLQLLPLPAGLWQSLGGRAELAAQLHAAGAEPGLRWTLDPTATERALLWGLPGIALYLSALRLPRTEQAVFVMALLLVAALGAVLGFAQLAGGPQSALRLYANTNVNASVGFFANSNHQACLLAMALPLAIAWTTAPPPVGRRDAGALWLARATGGLLSVLFVLALVVTRSRAGLVLGIGVLAIVVPVLWRLRGGRGVRRVAAGLLLVAAVLVVQFGFFAVAQRLTRDPLHEDRLAITRSTLDAAARYAPLGSGLGTFRQAFPPFERNHERRDPSTIVNHAHDDYAELWLEAGVPGALAALVFLAAVLGIAVRGVRRSSAPADRLAAVALAVAVAVPILHSLVDYPLRTSAVIAAFGLVLGLLAARAAADAPPAGEGASPNPRRMGYTGA